MSNIERLHAQLARSSDLHPDLFYRKIAARECAEMGDNTMQMALAIALGCGGFAIAGIPGAALAASGPILWATLRSMEGGQGLKEIESGDPELWRKRLPPLEAARYERDIKALNPAPSVPTGLPSASPETTVATESQAIPIPPFGANWNLQQRQLWERISRECPGIRYALLGKLVVVSGPQQSGKSSLAAAIAGCRAILLGMNTQAATPHPDGKRIFPGTVVGAGGDFEAIAQWYGELKATFSDRPTRRQTLIVDELTQYKGDWESLGQAIVWSALSESDKHGYAPIVLNHASTVSGGFAGIKGAAKLIESSAVQVVRQYQENEWGAQERSPLVRLVRPGQQPIEFALPEWLHWPTLQAAYCPPPSPSAPLSQSRVVVVPPQPVSPPPQPVTVDDNPFGQSLPSEDEVLSKLPHELKAIAEFTKRKGETVKAREIRSGIHHFKENGISTSQIRGYFTQLSQLGIGTVEGEGDFLSYRI